MQLARLRCHYACSGRARQPSGVARRLRYLAHKNARSPRGNRAVANDRLTPSITEAERKISSLHLKTIPGPPPLVGRVPVSVAVQRAEPAVVSRVGPAMAIMVPLSVMVPMMVVPMPEGMVRASVMAMPCEMDVRG